MKPPRVLFVISNMRDGDLEFYFPLGVAYLASSLELAGADIRVFDLDIAFRKSSGTSEDSLVYEAISEIAPDFVCIGYSSARYNYIKHVLAAIRKACDDIGAVMVIGGHAPSATPYFMKNATGADIVIRGEAEKILKTLVFNIKSPSLRPPNVLLGTATTNLDSLPFPAWHLFDMEVYSTPKTRLYTFGCSNVRTGFIIASRGCVGKCSFCYRMHKGYRIRSVDNIKKEIEVLQSRYNVGFIFLGDEMAFSSSSRTKKLCKVLREFGLPWATICRAEAVQDIENVKIMKDSGCVNLGIGFESMDDEVLRRANKMITTTQNIIAAENCKKIGLDMGINVIWNLPGDTKESLDKIVQFVIDYSAWNECRTIKPVTPYPGSQLFYEAIKQGKILDAEDFYNKFENLDLITVNFMDLPLDEAHHLLYEANVRLIDAYCEMATHELCYGDSEKMKSAYYKLYFEKGLEFRGVR